MGQRMADLPRRGGRAASRNGDDALDLRQGGEAGAARNLACRRERLHQRIVDARRPRDKGADAIHDAQQLAAGFKLRGKIEDVEQHDALRRVDHLIDGGIGERIGRNQIDTELRLPCEVERQIRLVHRRHRMAAHHRVAVDAVGLALIARKEVAEGGVALQLGRSDDQRRYALREDATRDLDGATDVADMRRGIEGGADLVVAEARTDLLQPHEVLRKVFVHPLRRLAAAGAGDPHRVEAREARLLLQCRDAREQHRLNAMQRHRLHHVGRAGEVIAVIGQQHQPAFPSPKKASDCASSLWSFA